MEFIFGCISKSKTLPAEARRAAQLFQQFLGERSTIQYGDECAIFCHTGPEKKSLPAKDVFHWTTSLAELEKDAAGRLSVRYDHSLKKLLIEADAAGFVPLFWGESPAVLVFCSFPEVITRSFAQMSQLDLKKVAEFVSHGFLAGGDSIYQNLRPIKRGEQLEFSEGQCRLGTKERLYEDPAIDIDSVKEVSEFYLERFCQRVNLFLQDSELQYCSLTGGSDTRLILAVLTPEQRARLKFATFYDPVWSANSNDADIATMLAKEFDLNHEVRPHQKTKSYEQTLLERDPLYVSSVNLPKKLCGTFGSETIGGAALWMMPSRPWSRRAPGVVSSHWLNLLFPNEEVDSIDRVWQKMSRSSEFSNFQASMEYCVYGPITAVYADVNALAWLHPHQLRLSQKQLPFLDGPNLELLKKVPENIVKDYAIQKFLFKHHFNQMRKIPFQSRITYEDPDFPSIAWKGEMVDLCLNSFDQVMNLLQQWPEIQVSWMRSSSESIPDSLKRRLVLLTSFLIKQGLIDV